MRRGWLVLLIAALGALAALAVVQRSDPSTANDECSSWLLTTAATPPAGPAGASPPSGAVAMNVRAGLAVSTSNDDVPRLAPTLTIQLPADQPEVIDLLRLSPAATPTPDDRNLYREALSRLLRYEYGGPFSQTTTGFILRGLREPPAIRVNGGIATLSFELPEALVQSLYDESNPVAIAPPWEVATRGRDLVLTTTVRGQTRTRATTWTGDVCLDGARLVMSEISPDSSDGRGQFTWRWTPREDNRTLKLTIRPGLSTSLRLWLATGQSRYIQYAWNYLVPALIGLAAVVAGMLVGPTRVERGERLRGRRELMLAATPVVALLAAALYAVAVGAAGGGQEWRQSRAVILAVAYAAFPLAATSLWRGSQPRWLLPALAANGVFGAVLHGLVVRQDPADRYGAGLAPLWSFATLLGGVSFLIVAMMPERSYRWIPARWRRPIWWVVTTAAVVAASAHWWWSQYQLAVLWERASFAESPVRRGPDFYDWLVATGAFTQFPIASTAAAVNLLPLIALASFVFLLESAALAATGRFFQAGDRQFPGPRRDRRLLWMLIVVFGVFVAGTDGAALGFRLPLALLFSAPLLRLAVRDSAPLAVEAILAMNRGVSETDIVSGWRRRELLRRAGALETLDRRFKTAYDRYGKDQPSHATYFTEIDALQAEQRRIRQGQVDAPPDPPLAFTAPPPSLRLPAGADPRRLALGLGPSGDWWCDGLLAARLGAVLAILPVGYYLYVAVTSRWAAAAADLLPFGGLDILTGVATEAGFWVGAAFTLGALYPYLLGGNGMQKAAVLAVVFGLARAFAALILNEGDNGQWLVRAFQLLLFLLVLGVWLDLRTLDRHRVYRGHLVDHYELRNLRTAAVYLSASAGTLLVVIQQLASGQAREGVLYLLTNLPSTVPALPS